MTRRYRNRIDQNALKAHICERVLATGSIAAACREAGMPHVETVRNWAADDVSFKEMLKVAQRKGWFRLKWAFDAAKAGRVLAHLRAGGTLAELPTGADWPTLRMIRYWRRTDGEFGAEVHRLNTTMRGNRGRTFGLPARPFDRATADRVILVVGRGARADRLNRIDPCLPGHRVIARWRLEDEDFASSLAFAMKVGQAARARAPRMLTPTLRKTILDRIREGASLASLGAEPDMPAKTTMYGWIRRSPEFARDVMAACDDREDWWTDQIGEAMEGVTSAKALKEKLAPLNKAWQRHQNRPGRKWR